MAVGICIQQKDSQRFSLSKTQGKNQECAKYPFEDAGSKRSAYPAPCDDDSMNIECV